MRAAVETFHALRNRQTADTPAGATPTRVNLLNWDGNGAPPGMFPPEKGQPGYGDGPETQA
jgi:nitrate reductase beta subunit